MGIFYPGYCYITGLDADRLDLTNDPLIEEYSVTAGGKTHMIRMNRFDVPAIRENEFLQKNKAVFAGMLARGEWFEDELELIDGFKLFGLYSRWNE